MHPSGCAESAEGRDPDVRDAVQQYASHAEAHVEKAQFRVRLPQYVFQATLLPLLRPCFGAHIIALSR